MNQPAIHALVGFALVTLALVLVVFAYRGVRLLGGTAITSWPRGSRNPNDAGFINRVADAHANCLENLPVFAVLVFAAFALGKMDVANAWAPYAFYARCVQSGVHTVGVNTPLVLVRATAWAVQLAMFILIAIGLLH